MERCKFMALNIESGKAVVNHFLCEGCGVCKLVCPKNAVEIKDVELPDEMKRAMAAQAEAERERRAKIISAQGEYQAAEKLTQAAEIMSKYPAALQLRYLQTLNVIAAENNSTTVFPIPLEMLRPFMTAYYGNKDNQ